MVERLNVQQAPHERQQDQHQSNSDSPPAEPGLTEVSYLCLSGHQQECFATLPEDFGLACDILR